VALAPAAVNSAADAIESSASTFFSPAADPAKEVEKLIGTTIGSYKIIKLLDTGGMADVFLAENTGIGRRVALKRLHPRFAKRKEVVERLFEEARTVNKISHINIVQVTDFIATEDGQACLVMELLEGHSLSHVLLQEGRIEPLRAVRIAIQVADALSTVHEKGIVHLDLKPGNIFVTDTAETKDFVKVLDFGISTVVYDADSASGTRRTGKPGHIFGTPAYMAPEQLKGEQVDRRTDIYAFGILLYEMMSGENPFEAKVGEHTGTNQVQLVPSGSTIGLAALQRVPPEIDRLVLLCLAKAPSQRFQTMKEVLAELKDIQNTLTAAPREGEPSARKAAAAKRRTRLIFPAALGLAGGSLLLAALFGYQWLHSSREAAPAGTAARGEAFEKIIVGFGSIPPGAEVFVKGDNLALGRTPFKRRFDRTGEVITVELRLAGYAHAVKTIRLDGSDHIHVVLKKDGSGPAPRGPGRPGKRAGPRN